MGAAEPPLQLSPAAHCVPERELLPEGQWEPGLAVQLAGAEGPPAQAEPAGQAAVCVPLLQYLPGGAVQEEEMGGLEPPAHT